MAQRNWLWNAHPPSPELMAALLQVLSPVLRAASEPEFTDSASWLIAAPYRRDRPRRRGPDDPAVLPPFTRRAFMSSRLPGRPEGFLAKFLHPEPQLARQGLSSAHIPGYLDRDDVLEQVTPHLAPKRGAGPGSWLQRRFAALCLVLMVGDAVAWDEAAAELGLPPLTDGYQPRRRLLITDLLAFRDGLIVLGSRLVERGLVDYRARRLALADLTEMPAADWAGRPRTRKMPERYDRGRVFAAAWIWSELTGGRYDESPAWIAHPELDAPATPGGSSRFYAAWMRSGTHPTGLAPIVGLPLSGGSCPRASRAVMRRGVVRPGRSGGCPSRGGGRCAPSWPALPGPRRIRGCSSGPGRSRP